MAQKFFSRNAYQYQVIGLADADHYRVVAELSDDELNVQISTLNISERKLTLAEAGKLRLFNRACRVAAGAQPRPRSACPGTVKLKIGPLGKRGMQAPGRLTNSTPGK